MNKHAVTLQDDHGGGALLTCEVCRQEIPVDEAISDEAADYVFHLCGPACYAEWQNQQNRRPGD